MNNTMKFGVGSDVEPVYLHLPTDLVRALKRRAARNLRPLAAEVQLALLAHLADGTDSLEPVEPLYDK
jgi:hypothetical protein